MKLEGNTILITGGSSGIGLAFAKEFVKLGNKVVVTGRNQEKLDRVLAQEDGLEGLTFDVSDPAAILKARDEVQEKHPELNVLMNNAGVFRHVNVARSTDDLEDVTSEVSINLNGAIHTVTAFVDIMKRNQGAIINVTSGLAFVPMTSAPIYCATKAALHSYTITLRQQLSDTGVEVIELMPPAVKTEMTAEIPDDAGFAMITTDQLVKATVKGLRSGKVEIRPAQANQLHWMSRIAPGFIRGQLEKGTKGMVPA